MVNLTRPVSARLTPVLNHAEDLLTGRGYGRKNIQDKDVAFKEKLPLSLKNLVSNQSTKVNKDSKQNLNFWNLIRPPLGW